jgi:CheY-like chemotaxis protein
MPNNAVTVLLVEDSSDDAALTIAAFSKHQPDYQVVHLHDGKQALDYLHRRGEFAGREAVNPELIFLDLKMPRVDGFAVLDDVRKTPALSNIPIVVLTSSVEPRDVERAYRSGTNAYVAKPVDFSAFVAEMECVSRFWLHINQPPVATA